MISFIINSCSQFIENNFKVFYKEQRIHTNYFRVWNFGKLFTSLPAIRAEHHKRKADKLVTFLKHHSYRKLIGAFFVGSNWTSEMKDRPQIKLDTCPSFIDYSFMLFSFHISTLFSKLAKQKFAMELISCNTHCINGGRNISLSFFSKIDKWGDVVETA